MLTPVRKPQDSPQDFHIFIKNTSNYSFFEILITQVFKPTNSGVYAAN